MFFYLFFMLLMNFGYAIGSQEKGAVKKLIECKVNEKNASPKQVGSSMTMQDYRKKNQEIDNKIQRFNAGVIACGALSLWCCWHYAKSKME